MCDDEVKSILIVTLPEMRPTGPGGRTRSPGRQTWFESEGRARTDFLALILSPSLFLFSWESGSWAGRAEEDAAEWMDPTQYLLSPKA